MSETNFFLWDDSGKKDVAIFKHYIMNFIDKRKWDNFRGNYRKWNSDGLSACMFKTILKMHHVFTTKDIDHSISDSDKISLRCHHRAIRDYYDEVVEELEIEVDDLKNNPTYENQIKIIKKECRDECLYLENEIEKLKKQLQIQTEKTRSHAKIMAKREVYLNKQIELFSPTSE
jgi:hypothetical protein